MCQISDKLEPYAGPYPKTLWNPKQNGDGKPNTTTCYHSIRPASNTK